MFASIMLRCLSGLVTHSALLCILLWQSPLLARGIVVRREEWKSNQINRTLCLWGQHRGAVLRDAFYLDGGSRTYFRGFADGTFGDAEGDEGSEDFFVLNFTQSFDTGQNASDIIQRVPKVVGAGNNVAPNYYEGMLFSNDYELYMYGGLLADTDSISAQSATLVVGYEKFLQGPEKIFGPGLINGNLPEGMTRYLAAGAGVNVPSEQLGFYFGGMRRPDWGEIRTYGNPRYNVTAVANTLISVDMSVARQEKWANATLPSSVRGRANAELVWIPTSDQGLLVVIGGVVNPEWAFMEPFDAATVENRRTGPGFVGNISIYDISNKKWYTQETSGAFPPPLTQFCSVMAAAKDGSSYNIYIYGGYDGIDPSAPSDDVYILSIPAFRWFKADTGSTKHARRSHKCAKVYPDQMFVVGGETNSNDYNCLDAGVVRIFNLNTLTWQNKYDPNSWSEYKVPSIVTAAIGGSADGGATTLKPNRWGDPALPGLFAAKYTKTITPHYPYASIAPKTDPSLPTVVPSPSSGPPSWIGPVLGVVLGILICAAILTGWILWRRRKYLKHRADSSDAGNSNRIVTWLRGTQPVANKSATMSTTEVGASVNMTTTELGSHEEDGVRTVNPFPQEAMGNQIHEMPDTSQPPELDSMREFGLTPSSTMRTRPRPVAHASHPSSSSSVGADIPRAESPTTSGPPGHKRQVSSLGSADFPSPASTFTSGSEGTGVERENPMESVRVVSPLSEVDNE